MPDGISEGTGTGLTVGIQTEPSRLNTFQSLQVEEESSPALFTSASPTVVVATHSESAIGAVHSSSCQLTQQSPLLFSHLEHSTTYDQTAENGGSCSSCWERSPLECSGSSSDVCPSCGAGRVANQNSDDILTSFNSLSVSNSEQFSCSNSPRVLPATSAISHLSCRQQAASYGGGARCLDDTTVDDLAGYLDEIMFLPKPMSEMAELMYT